MRVMVAHSLSPQLVVCSRVTEVVEREALGWIELRDILSVLDEAERLQRLA
jgi:hypothetical protein